jgi:nucleoside-diphosphate-sugar epimerase
VESRKPHSDYAISKYGAEMEARSARRLDVIIVNPGIIMVGFQEQGSGQLWEVANGLRYYTLGKGAFVRLAMW